MSNVPDSIPQNLADLLQQKLREGAPLPGLPRPSFSKEHHGELALLMVALASNCAGPKPEPIHYASLANSLLIAMHEGHKRMLECAVQDNADPGVIANLAQTSAVAAMARFTMDQLMEFMRMAYGNGCRSEQVSDDFLAALGLERSQFKSWFDSNLA